jgi:hypothetical protein
VTDVQPESCTSVTCFSLNAKGHDHQRPNFFRRAGLWGFYCHTSLHVFEALTHISGVCGRLPPLPPRLETLDWHAQGWQKADVFFGRTECRSLLVGPGLPEHSVP